MKATDSITEMLFCSIFIENQIRSIDKDKAKAKARREANQAKINKYRNQ